MSRSKYKGPYIKQLDVKNKKAFQKYNNYLPIVSRSSEIVPKFVGLTFNIHNGKTYVERVVTSNMVGYKFGEFSFTRSKFKFKKNKK